MMHQRYRVHHYLFTLFYMSSSTKENAGNRYCPADDFSNLNQQPGGTFWPQQQPPLQRKQQ